MIVVKNVNHSYGETTSMMEDINGCNIAKTATKKKMRNKK
jgi:hypothetical protein